MNEADALDIMQNAIWTVLIASGPAVLAAMTVGIIIAFVQALTQIQEMTLTFVPKIIAVMVAIAIVLMHGYRHHAHEARVAQLAREAGFTQVSVSHEVSPMMKLVARGDTTVVDAYLSPILRRYVEQVAGELPGVTKSSW